MASINTKLNLPIGTIVEYSKEIVPNNSVERTIDRNLVVSCGPIRVKKKNKQQWF